MPNGIAYVETTLVNRLLGNIPSGFVLEKIKLPNAPFTTPADKWLRCTVNGGAVEQLDAQGAFELSSGILTIDVFYALGAGTLAANTTADSIKQLYNGYRFQDIVITSVIVVPRGVDENWWRIQIDINFEYQTYDPTIT